MIEINIQLGQNKFYKYNNMNNNPRYLNKKARLLHIKI